MVTLPCCPCPCLQVVHVVGNVESPGSGPDTGSARRSSGYGGYEEYEVMAPNMAPQVGTTLRRLSSSSESSVTVPQDVHRRSTVYPLGRPLSPVTSSPSTSSIPPTPIEKNNLDDAEYDEVYTPQQNTDDDFEQPEYSVLVRGPAPVRTKPLPIRQLSNSRLRSLSTSLPDVTEIQDISKYSESYTGMSPSPTTWDRPPAPLPILQKQGAISERPRRPLFTRTDSAPSMTSEEREVRQSPSPQHETPPSQISLCTTMSSPVLGTVTSLDSITSGSRSPSAGSGTGIRKISSAISLRVKRRSQQKDREVLPTVRDGAPSRSLTKCQSDISVVSGDSVSPVLSRTSIDISTPDRAVITTTLQDKKVHTGSPESSGTRSAVTTPNEKSASAKVPFWRNKRLSIYVSKRKESSTGKIVSEFFRAVFFMISQSWVSFRHCDLLLSTGACNSILLCCSSSCALLEVSICSMCELHCTPALCRAVLPLAKWRAETQSATLPSSETSILTGKNALSVEQNKTAGMSILLNFSAHLLQQNVLQLKPV